MAPWRQLWRGVRALVRREETDREIAAELEHYASEAAADHEARGLSPEAARRAARAEVGNPLVVRERVRGYGWENAVESLFADLRQAVRRLGREPVFTVVAVVTLAVGIGATTAIFSAVRPILIDPLPYPDPGRVATIREVAGDGSTIPGTFGMYRHLSQRARSFESIAVMKPWRPTLTGPDLPERLEGQRVSREYFDVLGIAPALGRGFEPAEDERGGPAAALLGDRLWRRRFGGDPAIVGRTLLLDGAPHMVIGVLPESFENVLAPGAEIWAPLQYDLSMGAAWGHHLRTVGRLRAGVDREAAGRELDAVGAAVLEEIRPVTYGSEVDFDAVSLHDEVTRDVRPALLAIFGAVLLVLVVACVDVTHLLLARGVRRSGELSLRTALGAPRARLIRQVLTESLALAAAGGLAGLGLAVLGVRALIALAPADLPRIQAIGVDRGSLLFSIAVTTVIGLAFGALPALRAVRDAPGSILDQSSARTVGGPYRARGLPSARDLLVIAEVALALVVLVGAGLLLRSIDRLFVVDPGFDPSHRLTMQVQVAGPDFDDDGATLRYFERVLEAVRAVPGVEDAALTSQLPMGRDRGDIDAYGVHFDPEPPADAGEDRSTFRYGVSPGYFEAMGIPLRRGRGFEAGDRAGAPPVAVISASMALRRLPGLDPIGRRLRIGPPDLPPFTVVGVVGDVRQVSLSDDEAKAVYTTFDQWHFTDRAMSIVVRARGDAESLAPAVRRAVWSVDDDQSIARVATLADLLAASIAERRFASTLLVAFALAALILAAAGIYGVLSGDVAERRREIGVRSALGASRGDVLGLVLREGAALTAVGVGVGLVVAAAASRVLGGLLFGISPLDPATYCAVVALVAAVAALACGAPAWRAARVDPATTLRGE